MHCPCNQRHDKTKTINLDLVRSRSASQNAENNCALYVIASSLNPHNLKYCYCSLKNVIPCDIVMDKQDNALPTDNYDRSMIYKDFPHNNYNNFTPDNVTDISVSDRDMIRGSQLTCSSDVDTQDTHPVSSSWALTNTKYAYVNRSILYDETTSQYKKYYNEQNNEFGIIRGKSEDLSGKDFVVSRCISTDNPIHSGGRPSDTDTVSFSRDISLSHCVNYDNSSARNITQENLDSFLKLQNHANYEAEQDSEELFYDTERQDSITIKLSENKSHFNQNVLLKKSLSDNISCYGNFELNDKESTTIASLEPFNSWNQDSETVPPKNFRSSSAYGSYLQSEFSESLNETPKDVTDQKVSLQLQSKNGHVEQSQRKIDANFFKSCTCRVCQHRFKDVFALNFHIYKRHEKNASPTCIRCSAKFPTLSAFHHHLQNHKRLLLKQTAKVVQRQEPGILLRQNGDCHVPDSAGVSPKNNSQIMSINGRLPHLQKLTLSIFHCGECGKEYKHKKTLIAHVRFKHLHFPKKVHRCGHCFRSFSSRWQLNNHVSWWHLGMKPYICQFCGQGFVCLPTLKRHQRKVHTGEKPYRCFCCNEDFFEKKTLDLHKAQMHTGIFPFVCSQCGQGFVQRCYLKTHLKIHSGLRPYKCLVCGKQYSKISHLKRHQIPCLKRKCL